MEAVKMPKVVQPRGQARSVSGASSDAVKGSDEFMKLLQVKKDQPQPDKADNKQTEVKDSPKDPAEEIPQDKQEDTGDTQEQIPAEDTAGQDALLQAAMQQAAAQMTGIVTVESPQQPEVVEAKMAVAMETEAPFSREKGVVQFIPPRRTAHRRSCRSPESAPCRRYRSDPACRPPTPRRWVRRPGTRGLPAP